MFDSIISSAHHYYMIVFRPEQNISLKSLINKYFEENLVEIITLNYQQNEILESTKIYHCQKKINRYYGSKTLLINNLDNKDQQIWYDFYIGDSIIENTSIIYICFPYKSIQNYLLNTLMPEIFANVYYYKPSMQKILNYMRDLGNVEVDINQDSLKSNLDFKADITKYVATITEDNAKKVQIIGSNPLKSKVFELLNEPKTAKLISIETSSMKLNCTLFGTKLLKEGSIITSSGTIDILFDHYGNYRFWLPHKENNDVSSTFKMVPLVLRFFEEIDGFEDKNVEVISDKEDLENDK